MCCAVTVLYGEYSTAEAFDSSTQHTYAQWIPTLITLPCSHCACRLTIYLLTIFITAHLLPDTPSAESI